MKPLDAMSSHELARLERRLKHDVQHLDVQRHRPSKRRRLALAHEREQLKTQIDAVAAEWTRRSA